MRSNTEWRMWGKCDPLWSVASWAGKEKQSATSWTDEAFYELGRSDWEDFLNLWRQYSNPQGAIVEIGCGAGRLTKHIADHFETVHALDVSQDMIDYARRINRSNVIFHIVEGTSIPVESANACFSAHVFQHLDGSESAMAYFREIHRTLKPGGSMMIHIPIESWPSGTGSFIKFLYKLRRVVISIRATALRGLIRIGFNRSLMTSQSFRPEQLLSDLSEIGFKSLQISIISVRSNGSAHAFVLGKA